VKLIEMVPSTAAVGDGPAKQTNQPVQRRLVGPLSPRPTTRILIAKPSFTAKPNLEAEFAELRKAFRIYRSTYLSRVFAVVTRWQRLDCALKRVGRFVKCPCRRNCAGATIQGGVVDLRQCHFESWERESVPNTALAGQ
jgi:hypothetical protein